MAPKRKSAEEIWSLHKKLKAMETPARAVMQEDLPGTPPPTESESSTAQIMREAVEDFKKFAAFEDILALSGSQYFAEGFYACRNWIGHIMPRLDLSHQCISTIPSRHLYLPPGYLEQVELALQNALWEDAEFVANRGAIEAHNEEMEEATVVVADMEVVEDLEDVEVVKEVVGRGRRAGGRGRRVRPRRWRG